MNVLIAVDESPESLDAADAAVRFFGERAHYLVVSVGQRMPIYVGGFAAGAFPNTSDLTRQIEAARLAAEDAAKQAQQRLPEGSEVDVEIGDAGRLVCEAAKEHDADVVVVGSHHRSFWERIVDPSVGRYLIDHAPCPVLVVR